MIFSSNFRHNFRSCCNQLIHQKAVIGWLKYWNNVIYSTTFLLIKKIQSMPLLTDFQNWVIPTTQTLEFRTTHIQHPSNYSKSAFIISDITCCSIPQVTANFSFYTHEFIPTAGIRRYIKKVLTCVIDMEPTKSRNIIFVVHTLAKNSLYYHQLTDFNLLDVLIKRMACSILLNSSLLASFKATPLRTPFLIWSARQNFFKSQGRGIAMQLKKGNGDKINEMNNTVILPQKEQQKLFTFDNPFSSIGQYLPIRWLC